MPKQILKLNEFHGGINSNSDPRDLRVGESPSLVDAAVDSVGKITTLGSVSTDINTPFTNTILANKGLFVMSSDRQLDGGEADETFIFNYDTGGTNIDINDSEGWDIGVISFGGAASPVYYSADGVVRVADADLTRTSQWFGYIEDQTFVSFNGAGPTAHWANADQSLSTPTSGKCLISTPYTGSDSNGVNSSSGEYIGDTINGAGTDVVDHSSVNLRVGLSYEKEIDVNFAEADEYVYSVNEAAVPSITHTIANSTDLYSITGGFTLRVGQEGLASVSDWRAIKFQNESNGDLEYVINDENVLIIPFFMTTTQYDMLEKVKIKAYNFSTTGSSTGVTILNWFEFSSDDIAANCWNLLVCDIDNATNASVNYDLDYDSYEAWVYQNNTAPTNDTPIFYLGSPVQAKKAEIEGWQPGVYDFHYTWIYDRSRQESLPFKFSDVDGDALSGTHDGGDNVDSVMTDSGESFTVDALIGRVIHNTSNYSHAVITDNTDNDITGDIEPQFGASEDNWDTNDNWEVRKDNVNKICIVGAPVMLNFDVYMCPWSEGVTATADFSDEQIDKTSHGLKVGDIIRFTAEDIAEVNTSTDYYVSSQSLVANSFRISSSLANAVAGTSIDLSAAGSTAVKYIYYTLNKRIVGSRIYWTVEENDNYFLLGELDFIGTEDKKGFKWLPESDTSSYLMANTANTSGVILSKSVVIRGISPESPNTIDTFKTINGFSTEVESLDAYYKTAVVHGRRAYIGNIKQNGKKYPDRILKSQVNKFDTFPENMGAVDVAIRDGENIVKLEAFADRILQFKERSLYIINVSENVDFLEDVYRNKGCAFDYHVVRTDLGVAWFNKFGVYLFDGKTVHNLLEKDGIKVINEADWEAFITDGEDGSSDDADMSSAHIGYIPKKRQLLIKNENTDVFIYDFVLRSWTKGSSKIAITTNMTNFALDGDEDLFYISNTDSDIVTWSPSSASSAAFVYQTPDIDFGQPGQRKKIYKVYVTYKSASDTNVRVRYDTNGGTDFDLDFETGDNYAEDNLQGTGSAWAMAELKPDTSSESNNIKSFQLKFYATGTVPATFEINDISIIYRAKPVK